MKNKFSWKNLLSILLLIFCYPLGLVVLWILPSWKRDVKLLITSSVLIPLSFFILPSYLPSCKIAPHLNSIATGAWIFILILIFSAFLLSRKRKSSRSLWIKTLYILELVIAITGSLLVSGMQCFYRPY